MKKLIFSLLIGNILSIYSIPGKIIKNDPVTGLPTVSLDSLDLENYKTLKVFKPEDLPEGSNWEQRSSYYKKRNRTVYLTKDHKFVLKVWQKDYPSRENFLSALRANFYKGIASLSALIFDEDNELRGYISPYMVDRTFQRTKWESFGFVLEKGPINVSIFSDYCKQPQIFKDLFDKLINRSNTSDYISLDFCPNNVVINAHDKKAYIVDLEDVYKATEITAFIASIFSPYLSNDYLKMIGLLKDTSRKDY